jgi:haloacetate dehalogenase
VTPLSLFPNFKYQQVDLGDVVINVCMAGQGSPILLLHGHPQTHAIWHRVAPTLALKHCVVMTDLRGYGDSSKPKGLPDHSNYSKRTMALDQLRVMNRLGFAQFDVLAHDRGARVAHRLGIDHPESIRRLMLLDIAPTLAMYRQTHEDFARSYWHWFFLIQPSPLPERLIEASPRDYIHDVMGNRSAGMKPFDPRAVEQYVRCLSLPGAAHGLCEDYRASAFIDLEHDTESLNTGAKFSQPLRVLWGQDGVIQRCFDPLNEWIQVAQHVSGKALACGHYIPEEAPEDLLMECQNFFQ